MERVYFMIYFKFNETKSKEVLSSDNGFFFFKFNRPTYFIVYKIIKRTKFEL
jgi:hypothetical protein